MADFDSFDYDIESRLPEWWKESALAVSVNKYTQDLISQILEGLLESTGVAQPLNVWKTIPEEYNWFHHYTELDNYLVFDKENIHEETPTCTFFPNSKTTAYVPNTKRKCDAEIHLRLLGEPNLNEEEDFLTDKLEDFNNIGELKITNGIQEIIIREIPKVSTIDILTESNQILINGEERLDLVEGGFKKIQPTIKYDDYRVPHKDEEGNTYYSELDLEDENKETKIVFECDKAINFDLQIRLLKPTYTTEQNIKIATVSAFPIEWVRLYGYFCHPFNNKDGYKLLYEKEYSYESRTVYDRITRQHDCERFYIQVKFHGIGGVLTKGFPQNSYDSNPAFQPNLNLDKWGKIYGLPRRVYREDITEDEEPYTFPKYYNYPIEQDFWYEERMINEYQFDDQAINSYFIKDDEFNNVARLECISPFTNELWVYTETIDASSDTIKRIKDIDDYIITEIEDSEGVSIKNLNDVIVLEPNNINTLRNNKDGYKTKKFKCSFDLSDYIGQIPKDIDIKGIELKFKADTNVHSDSLRLNDESYMILPFYSLVNKDAKTVMEKIKITEESNYWIKEKDSYVFGSSDYLFGQQEITYEQLFLGNNGRLDFELGFINENEFLQAKLFIEDIKLNIYYEKIPEEFDINITLDKDTITKRTPEPFEMNIHVENKGRRVIEDKDLFIVLPKELEFPPGKFNSYNIKMDIDEEFDIPVEIVPKENIPTGYYDILVFCNDKEVFKQVLVTEGRE